jgi:hypothetical protein
MKTNIHICSYARDFRYLFYCLRSIVKFTSGFNQVVLLIPNKDSFLFTESIPDDLKDKLGNFIKVIYFDEWENKGMLHHMYKVLIADIDCPDVDYILHLDSDIVITQPMDVSEFFCEDKPILFHMKYETLGKNHPGVLLWQVAVTNALGWVPDHEFMRSRFLTYKRTLYSKTRELIENYTKQSLDEYIKIQKNEFPQTFAEYPTLGEVAWKFFHDDYYWVDVDKEEHFKFAKGDAKIRQAWSHRPPTDEDITTFKNLGLL